MITATVIPVTISTANLFQQHFATSLIFLRRLVMEATEAGITNIRFVIRFENSVHANKLSSQDLEKAVDRQIRRLGLLRRTLPQGTEYSYVTDWEINSTMNATNRNENVLPSSINSAVREQNLHELDTGIIADIRWELTMAKQHTNERKTYSQRDGVQRDEDKQRTQKSGRERVATKQPSTSNQVGVYSDEMPDDVEREEKGAQQRKPGSQDRPRSPEKQRQ